MAQRAKAAIPPRSGWGQAALAVVVAGGPPRSLLRPSELEDKVLVEHLLQLAMFGPQAVLSHLSGTVPRVERGALLIEQERASIRLDELGTVAVIQDPRGDQAGRVFGLPVLIEEHMRDRLERGLSFILAALEQIDPVARLGNIVVVAGLFGAQAYGWRTLAEHQASPNSMSLPTPPDRIVVALPTLLNVAALRARRLTIVEDLLVLLRREVFPRGQR